MNSFKVNNESAIMCRSHGGLIDAYLIVLNVRPSCKGMFGRLIDSISNGRVGDDYQIGITGLRGNRR